MSIRTMASTFLTFSDALKTTLDHPLPGHDIQRMMAPAFRPKEEEAKRYYANARKAAVLILFYPKDGAVYTVLIERPKYEGVHSGQMAFPGGKMEEADTNLIETALREAQEEVGVTPEVVEVVKPISHLYIPPSNSLVTPVIGLTDTRPDFVLQPSEVAGIVEVDVSTLADDSIIGTKKIRVSGGFEIESPFYDVYGHTVWGATAMMISELNQILRPILPKL